MSTRSQAMLRTKGLSKSFTLHLQSGATIAVLRDVDLSINAGECVVLSGPSGTGKSTLMRSLYGNYRAESGHVLVHHCNSWVDLADADPRMVLDVRRETLGYVSQFLRVVPRVPTIEIVAEALTQRGTSHEKAVHRARAMLLRLNLPEPLHHLPPATFSGGEQQRVNLARGFIGRHPILLLDEPTASLDATNRDAVIDLVREAKAAGTAILGIVHDAPTRDAIADRLFQLTPLRTAA
jgi:alpha-D-ribose 1-methylphosphonate 5-triphosphate synthase subunit PhnL